MLRKNGFVTVRVSGARRLYAVDAAPLQEADQWLRPYRRFWNQRLDALGVETARQAKATRIHIQPRHQRRRDMTTDTTTYHEPDPEPRHRTIPAGAARVVVFTRTYATIVEDPVGCLHRPGAAAPGLPPTCRPGTGMSPSLGSGDDCQP